MEGTLKVWDLRSLLTMEPLHSSDLLLKVIPTSQRYLKLRHPSKLVSADEFQIVTADIVQEDVEAGTKVGSFLIVKSFVGKLDVK